MSVTTADRSIQNFRTMCAILYLGRGIIMGRLQNGDLVQIYFISGRSENSQNRVFDFDPHTGRLFTEKADPSKPGDPQLIIYNAMREVIVTPVGKHFVVSNGHQTDTVVDVSTTFQRRGLNEILTSHTYEPDGPNYTPRITGRCTVFASGNDPGFEISILRRSPFNTACDRHSFQYENIAAGYGYCITTYSGDGDPLPSFQGEPLLVPLGDSIENVVMAYATALNRDNLVSVAGKVIHPKSGASRIVVWNKHKKITLPA